MIRSIYLEFSFPLVKASPLLLRFCAFVSLARNEKDGKRDGLVSSLPFFLGLLLPLRLLIEKRFVSTFFASRLDARYRRHTTFCDCYLLNCGILSRGFRSRTCQEKRFACFFIRTRERERDRAYLFEPNRHTLSAIFGGETNENR